MPKYKLKVVTTFIKYIEYEGDSMEDAIERASGDVDVYDSATDTLEFNTEIIENKEEN